MTDAAAALRALAPVAGAARDAALSHFHATWRHDPCVPAAWISQPACSCVVLTCARYSLCLRRLVLVKWFGVQAACAPDAAAAAALTSHADFNWRTPNMVYAAVCGFARASYRGFHAADGAGYAWLADAVLRLDGANPQVAARAADAFTSWRKYDAQRQGLIKAQLERILAHPGLSPNVREIASKSLK